MKKIIFPIIAIIALFTLPGCSEKFKIAAPYKDITVVYGFLDMQDTAHYIRIQKAFLSQDKSALVMAQTPDSSFYANLNVKIRRFSFTDNVHPIDTIHLNRVNLDLEGYQKEPGSFFTAPNYAYKFTNQLNPNYIYRIVITNLTTGKTDSAETPIIDDVTPGKFYVDALDTNAHIFLDFHNTVGNKYFEMQGYFLPPVNFFFHYQSNPVVIAQAIVRFNWDDSNIATHQLTPHYYDYNTGYFNFTNNSIDFKIYNNSLYSAIASALITANPLPPNTARLLNKSEIYVYISTQDFLNYQQNSLTQGTGLTGSEIEPIYSNISGDNAIGLFTSRGMHASRITISKETIDSLMQSPILHDANIQGRIY